MGFFAIFNGLIYNEFFAIPLEIFGSSCYSDEVQVLSTKNTTLTNYVIDKYGYPKIESHCVYPFGFDPKWFISDQLLSYTNNFKMKLAVIFAII